jgi:serine/threonine protein kinase
MQDPAQRPSAREALEHKWIKQELSKHKTDALNNTNLHQYWQSRRARKHIQAVLSIKKMERALLMRNLNTSNPLSQRHSTMDEIEPAAEEQNQMPAAQMEPSIAVLDTAKALPGTPGTRSDSKDITSDIGHSAGSERAELNKSNSLVSTSSRVSADNGHSASRARPDLNKSDSLVSTSSRVSV